VGGGIVPEVDAAIPVARVTPEGAVEPLGTWHDRTRTLVLERPGFPFLRPGTHTFESRLPWVFSDMSPSGFLGARFSRAFPELGLPERTRDWSNEHVLAAISHRGEDLNGNLLIGEESIRRFTDTFAPEIRGGTRKRSDYGQVVEDFLAQHATGSSSWLGGERPKLLLHSVGTLNQTDCLLKFTPPLTTELGVRWRDLLCFEALASQVLAASGIDSVGAHPATFQVLDDGRRAGLLLRRFDRIGLLGRSGAATLYSLALSRGEFELSAPAVMRSLAREGLVPSADADTVERVHAFSHAIGNTDAHLGNYALRFDDEGRARLAPIYDVTAMVFAPVADELPDTRVHPRPSAVPSFVEPLVSALIERVRHDDRLSADFRTKWLRYVGA
jgi:hypothetical protein